jgi:hypothetical protein
MLSNKIITLPTNQGESAFMWHHRGHEHKGGNTVTVRVKLPKTLHVDGFPLAGYHVSVTPSQPCAVSVTNKDRYGFDVALTSLDAQPLAAGSFSVMCIG